jgi:hypothetical protein
VLYSAEPLRFRGYYFTFCRVQTWPLSEWKRVYDGIAADGGNLVILWVGGAFRSRKFPITWQYNREHKNVQSDFVRDLIDYGHTRGIRTLLGFTPFSYDGVNQYPLEHPELKAVQKNGNLAKLSGIHCWGYALNPSRPEAQKFMLDYVREMFFDFYSNADGLLIESSDYAVCYCPQCQGHYYEREFEFVKKISEEVWKAKPDAMVLVYPHYFSGGAVPGFGITAAKFPFDARWTLFFTPHSAHIDRDLIGKAKTTIYWDSNPALGTPRQIREGAATARSNGITGYVPSFEGFSFPVEHPEGGEQFLIGRRLKPFGFDWLADGKDPYEEILVRVNRIAYHAFTQNPELSFDEFKRLLAKTVFGDSGVAQATDDLLFLQESFFLNRSWFSASPMVSPALLKGKLEMGTLSTERLSDYNRRLDRIANIASSYSGRPGAAGEMVRVARWITDNWNDNRSLLADHLRQ